MKSGIKVSLKNISKLCALAIMLPAFALNSMAYADKGKGGDNDKGGKGKSHLMWINHFSLASGNPDELKTTANSTSSGVGGGLTGLVIQSGTLGTPGDVFSDGGNKVVHTALYLPKDSKITGLRVCYENSANASYITQIRLAQVQDPPSSAAVLLDDGTDLNATGPVCVDTASVKPAIKSKNGPVLLSLRANFGNVSDKIVIRGLGVYVK
jgi:hypothetical protein